MELSSTPRVFVFSCSLVFHLLLSFVLSFIFSLVFHLVFSSLVFHLLLSLVLSFCLRVLLWLLLWCVVGVVSCVLCLVLWCDTLKTKTSPCVPATRAHIFSCARGAGTHGDILNGHTGFSACHTTTQDTTHKTTHNTTHSSPKFVHVGLLRASEVHQKQALDLTHFQFENRSRTTCCRFLQSFALPEGNKLSGISRTICTSVSLRKSHCHGYSCRLPALVSNFSPLDIQSTARGSHRVNTI